MKKLLCKINKIFDDYIDKSIDKKEERKYIKLLKKYCKDNNFDSDTYKKYSLLIKNIFENINKKLPKDSYKNNLEVGLSVGQIQNRLYELNKEFIHLINLNCFHSGNAITRQVIELYLILYQINYDADYANVFTGNHKKHKGFPSFKQIRELIEDERIDEDYKYYSNNFHPKEDSFMRNLFLIPPEFSGNLILPFYTEMNTNNLEKIKNHNYTLSKSYYGNRHMMKKGWKLVSFVKNSAGPDRKKILDDFMHYSKLIIEIISSIKKY